MPRRFSEKSWLEKVATKGQKVKEKERLHVAVEVVIEPPARLGLGTSPELTKTRCVLGSTVSINHVWTRRTILSWLISYSTKM